MIVQDIYHKVEKMGNFMTLFGIADTHFLCDSTDSQAYQPLDYDAYIYLKYCANELREDKYYGKIISFTGGDLTELERSSVRKTLRSLRKNDTRGQDTIHKRILSDDILPKLKSLVKDTHFVGGVAGNHMIEFSQESAGQGYSNSEDYLIRRLGGKYCGEGKLLLNIHIQCGGQKVLKKVIITHGSKAGNKAAIIRELQQMYYQYGKVDLLIKCHAHDPLAGFYAKYDLPDQAGRKMKKQETLVMCLGGTRDGEKAGDGIKTAAYDDYCERFNLTPVAARYPVAVFRAMKPCANNRSMEVKIRPLIM